MKKNILFFIKKYWITLWLVLAAAALVVTASFAAYTSISSVKRVVSTQGTEVLFSSNYMSPYTLTDDSWSTKILTFNSTTNPTISVSVCNYGQGNTTKINEENITYTFTAQLVDKAGNAITDAAILFSTDYSVTLANTNVSYSFENGICSLIPARTLVGGESSRDVYVIHLDGEHMDEVNIKVTAVPNAASYAAAGNYKLARYLGTSVYSIEQSVSWNGAFSDTLARTEPSSLDGFNYEITGKGSGTVTLTWNTDYVEISPWFLADIAAELNTTITPTTSGSQKTVSFAVGGASQADGYRLQFYRTQAAPASETWDGSNSSVAVGSARYVQFSFAGG